MEASPFRGRPLRSDEGRWTRKAESERIKDRPRKLFSFHFCLFLSVSSFHCLCVRRPLLGPAGWPRSSIVHRSFRLLLLFIFSQRWRISVKSKRGFGGCEKGMKRGGEWYENGRKNSPRSSDPPFLLDSFAARPMGSSGSDEEDSAFNNGITLHVGTCG